MTTHTGPQAQEAGNYLHEKDVPEFWKKQSLGYAAGYNAAINAMSKTPARVVSDAEIIVARIAALNAHPFVADNKGTRAWQFFKDGLNIDPVVDAMIRAALSTLQSGAEGKDGEDLYYIQDTRQYVGNCVTWWGTERRGYVTRLDLAGKYPKDEAFRQAASRGSDKAWPCAVIEKLIRPTIDMQELPKDTALQPGQEG